MPKRFLREKKNKINLRNDSRCLEVEKSNTFPQQSHLGSLSFDNSIELSAPNTNDMLLNRNSHNANLKFNSFDKLNPQIHLECQQQFREFHPSISDSSSAEQRYSPDAFRSSDFYSDSNPSDCSVDPDFESLDSNSSRVRSFSFNTVLYLMKMILHHHPMHLQFGIKMKTR